MSESRFLRLHVAAALLAGPLILAACTGGETRQEVDLDPLTYPETQTGDVSETQFGVDVADPYRWLENDVREDSKVAEWVKAQNAISFGYLGKLPGREALAKRMTQLFDYARTGVPEKAGSRYFYSFNDGLQNQSVLKVRNGLDGDERVLIDPNGWSDDGATALAGWVPSEDGSKLVYLVQDGGSDWRTLKVIDVASGKIMDDTVEWVKFSGVDWVANDAGFVYSRYPEPEEGEAFQSLNLDHQIYYHKIGTDQSEDKLLYATPADSKLNHVIQMSPDKSFGLVTTSAGTDARYRLTLLDFTQDNPTARTIVSDLEHDWRMMGVADGHIYFVTDKDAPRLRIVKMPLDGDEGDLVEVIGENEAVIDGAAMVGNKLVINYMVDAKNVVKTTDLNGGNIRDLELPGIGSVGGFDGDTSDSETFFAFSSFNRPTSIYRFDSASGEVTPWAEPELAFDPEDYTVAQRFYNSKDGTRIPMFLVYRSDLDISDGAPTMLYGYGGFNISLTPNFSSTRLAWLDNGGVFALANIRGGGEYGKAWHDGGRLQNKQNVFDDFIAAGEYLIAEGITGEGQLAIEGRSNGGLLVGAVVNQRPDLFGAAHAAVGVMDMLRFDRFTAGRYWVDDYGYPSKEDDFKALYAYSPYHNIKDGTDYPAMIVTTADTDDRVVPGHSFKYIAALQAANTGDMPKIIRIETRAGHGSGKPTDKIIEEFSDIYAFLAYHTGLDIQD